MMDDRFMDILKKKSLWSLNWKENWDADKIRWVIGPNGNGEEWEKVKKDWGWVRHTAYKFMVSFKNVYYWV